MNVSAITMALTDKGGRRSGYERRQFSYSVHVPERRINRERRMPSDRRESIDRRYRVDRKILGKKLESFKNMMGSDSRREKQERRGDNERRAVFAAVLAPA